MARVTKVLIVDDHPAVREGLAVRISKEPDLQVCGEAASVVEAMKLLGTIRPHVAIVDLSLEGEGGIDLIKRAKAKQLPVPILIWSMHDESLFAQRALRAGAMGYISKRRATDQIIEAIRTVLAGKVYLSSEATGQVLKAAVGQSARFLREPIESLSDREMETYELIGKGLTISQIASKLRLSPKTVETYRHRIKGKLGIRSVNDLNRHALQWILEQR